MWHNNIVLEWAISTIKSEYLHSLLQYYNTALLYAASIINSFFIVLVLLLDILQRIQFIYILLKP